MVSNPNEPTTAAVIPLNAAQDQADGDLVARCRAGDRDAFDTLVRRYKDRVYNMLYRYLGNHEDAQDVAQEVFLRAYRGIGDFRGAAHVYTWLHSIAANLARNRRRDAGRKGRDRVTSLEGVEQAAPGWKPAGDSGRGGPREAAQHAELTEALERCLSELPDVYRLAFVMRISSGLAYEEIAAAAGCPKGTVKSRLNQARRLLRDCLRAHGMLETT